MTKAVDATPLRESNMPKMSSVDRPKVKKVSRTKRLLIISVISLAVGAGVGGFMYINQSTSPLDRYVKQYHFPLYYPSEMPSDYALAESSLRSTNTIFIYNLKSTSKKPTLTITQQALPADFDAAKLTSKDTPSIVTASGTLYDLSIGDVNKYMLTTGEGTIIFINTAAKINKEIIISLAADLLPAQ
jgi:hypothetical protein